MIRGLVPWETALRPWDEEVNEMFRQVMPEAKEMSFVPKTNVAETEQAFEITAELPGLKAEDFTVEFQNGALMIRGKKEEKKEEKGKTFHRVERRTGEFWRRFPLPTAVDREHVRADFKDGVLTVVVPKATKPEEKPIKVNVHGGNGK